MVDIQLADRAHAALRNSPHLPLRSLRLQASEGRVILQGTVGSFFQKQMAQETLRRVEGIAAIENQLEVQWA